MIRLRLALSTAAILVLLCCAHHTGAEDEVPAKHLPPKVPRAADLVFDNLFSPKNEVAIRTQFEGQLGAIADEISLHCGINEKQTQKLWLAGLRDIHRVFELIASGRNESEEEQKFAIIRQLQAEIRAGLFNRGSYFRKALPKILTGEQFAIYKAVDDRREAYRHRAVVESVVTMWDGIVPLRSKQRRNLVRLLLEETRPPLRFGPYDYCAVLYQVSRLPDERFTLLLDDAQWRVLRKSLREKHPEYAGLVEAGVVHELRTEDDSAPEVRRPE